MNTNHFAVSAEICQKSVSYVLNESKLKPYKMHCLLLEDDPDRCTEFAEIMVIISDYPIFCPNGQVIKHNCRFTSRYNLFG